LETVRDLVEGKNTELQDGFSVLIE